MQLALWEVRDDAFLTAMVRRKLVPVQVVLGDVAGAKAAAEKIAGEDVKLFSLLDVAEAQSEAGDNAGAKETLDSIRRKLADSPNLYQYPGERASQPCHMRLAWLYLHIGAVEDAASVADGIHDAALRAHLLSEVGLAQAKQGELAAAKASFAAATKVVKSEDDASSDGIGAVAGFEYQAGFKVEAEALVRGLPSARQRFDGLMGLGLLAGRRGDKKEVGRFLDGVLEVMPLVKPTREESAALEAGVGLLMIQSGDLPRGKAMLALAREDADAHLQGKELVEALGNLAALCEKAGIKDMAEEALSAALAQVGRLPKLQDRQMALWELAKDELQAGNLHGATALAQLAAGSAKTQPGDAEMIAEEIAEKLAQAEGDKAKLDWIAKLPSDFAFRAEVTAAAAKGMARGLYPERDE